MKCKVHNSAVYSSCLSSTQKVVIPTITDYCEAASLAAPGAVVRVDRGDEVTGDNPGALGTP